MARSRRGLPKGVRIQRYVLKTTGETVEYGYYGRGAGALALGRVGSAEFYEKVADIAKRGAKAVLLEPDDTVAGLIQRYQASIEFARLKPRTKADYRLMLDRIHTRFGPLSFEAICDRQVTQYIYEWRDEMSGSPRRADYAIQVFKALLGWGVRRGLLETNRASGVGRLYSGDRRGKTWSDAQISAFHSCAPEPLRRALVLAVETGQRQADLLSLPWSAIHNGLIELVQAKTNQPVAVPISAALREVLDTAPRGAVTILTTAAGTPWNPKGNGFRAAWREACRRAGVEGVTFHDLRGTFVTRRLSEGWSTVEVAICTGHSLRDLGMLDTYANRGRVAEATAQRLLRRANAE